VKINIDDDRETVLGRPMGRQNLHYTTLETHENPLLKTLLLREENRRLKRNWPIDLI
jgi:hypothetical protein